MRIMVSCSDPEIGNVHTGITSPVITQSFHAGFKLYCKDTIFQLYYSNCTISPILYQLAFIIKLLSPFLAVNSYQLSFSSILIPSEHYLLTHLLFSD